MTKIPFYDEYFKLPIFDKEKGSQIFKDTYIRGKLFNNIIYKFIAFTDDESLNKTKLHMLSNNQFWASDHRYFEDKREVFRKYNLHNVTISTNQSVTQVLDFFRTVDEVNDIACFTYEISNFMWSEYANQSNGFYMELKMLDTDNFFPVSYMDKNKIDYTSDIISSYSSDKKTVLQATQRLSLLPWVIKDLKYVKENELRFICGDIYDYEDGPMGGKIFAGKKNSMGYKGYAYSFAYAGLSLHRIVIGCNCTLKDELIDICSTLNVQYVVVVN